MNGNIRRTGKQVICLMVFMALQVGQSFGWSELSHIIINYHAGAIETNAAGVIEAYGELPDLWSSREEREGFLRFRITDVFTWSHNVIRVEGDDGGIPKEPDYRHPDHEPGINMLALRRHKLESEMENPSTNARKTARAFSTHNAADGIVHFEFFKGGGLTGTRWIQHALTERWADYVLYVRKLDDTAWWQRTQFPPQVNVGYEVDDIDIDLIRLSQMVNRKNRLSIAKDKCGYQNHIEVMTSGDIELAINDIRDKRQEEIDGMTWIKYQAIRRAIGGASQWTAIVEMIWIHQLENKFDESVQAVQAAIAEHADE